MIWDYCRFRTIIILGTRKHPVKGCFSLFDEYFVTAVEVCAIYA